MNRRSFKSSMLLATLIAGSAMNIGCLGEAGQDQIVKVEDDGGTVLDAGTSTTATTTPDAGQMIDAGMTGCSFGSQYTGANGESCVDLMCSEQTFVVCSGTDGSNGVDGASCTATLDMTAPGCVNLICDGSPPQQICSCSLGAPMTRADGRTCSTLSCPGAAPREICNGLDGVDGVDGASCTTSVDTASGCVTLSCPGESSRQICPPPPCTVSPTRTSSVTGETCFDITCPPAPAREACIPPGVGCSTSQDGACSVTTCDDGTSSRVCPPPPPAMATCTSTQTVTMSGDMRRDCLVQTCDYGTRVESTELFCTTTQVASGMCPRGTIDCPCNPDGSCNYSSLVCQERVTSYDQSSGVVQTASRCVRPTGCTRGELGCDCNGDGSCNYSSLSCEDRNGWGWYQCERVSPPPDAGVQTPDATVPDSGSQQPDAGFPDATVPDSGTIPDSGSPDGGVSPDASAPDATTPPSDAGFPDAGPCGGTCPAGRVCVNNACVLDQLTIEVTFSSTVGSAAMPSNVATVDFEGMCYGGGSSRSWTRTSTNSPFSTSLVSVSIMRHTGVTLSSSPGANDGTTCEINGQMRDLQGNFAPSGPERFVAGHVSGQFRTLVTLEARVYDARRTLVHQTTCVGVPRTPTLSEPNPGGNIHCRL